MSDPVVSHALAKRAALVETLTELVACPSVGADPEMADGMEQARCLIEAKLAEMDFKKIQRLQPLEQDSGHPSVYAERLDAPGQPTILIYAHYDVQPADPVEEWATPPFTATQVDERLYGRGISDDKGPMLIALEALNAFIAVKGALPVNVKLLIEGEEETGSLSLPEILERYSDLLSADAVLSADGARWRPELVSLNVGSRGNAGFDISVQTAAQDLHSGRFGGIIRNPLHELAALIASLHDDEGRIAATGFYDGVLDVTERERAELSSLEGVDGDTIAKTGVTPFGEIGYSTLERLWHRPCLDVNGMWGGYTGAGSKTVIPREAHAKITMRLVPGQDPEHAQAAVIAYLKSKVPDGVRLTVSGIRGVSGAYAVPKGHPLLDAASDALEATTGQVPLQVKIGASLPLAEIVKRKLGIDTVMFSFAMSDENFHAPNEFFRQSSIEDGLKAWVQILREISTKPTEAFAPYRDRRQGD